MPLAADPGARMSPVLRWLWLLTVGWGAAILWMAFRPPMIDLPQHAAQISLLRDLVDGTSRFSEDLAINVKTPYLTMYAATFLLASVMSVVVAIKLILTIAYVSFVAMAALLRQSFRAPALLDWLLPASYFGFAWKWGFTTFLVAAPIGLLFIWLVSRQVRHPTRWRATGIVATGLVLLVSHGLVFAFAFAVAGGICCLELLRERRWPSGLAPLLICGFVCVFCLWIASRMQTSLGTTPSSHVVLGLSALRFLAPAVYVFDSRFAWWQVVPVCTLALAPWVAGLKLRTDDAAAYAVLTIAVLLFLSLPTLALDTGYLWQRFALFMLPGYACLFATGDALPSARYRHAIAAVMLIVGTCTALYVHSSETTAFGRESGEFEELLTRLEPAERALYLPFDRDSKADRHPDIYVHYGLWYQAEKHGLVDFNFAWFAPQIVRYRSGHYPAVRDGIEWKPASFDWSAHAGGSYRYFLIRSEEAVDPNQLFRGAPCLPHLLVRLSMWQAFENGRCE